VTARRRDCDNSVEKRAKEKNATEKAENGWKVRQETAIKISEMRDGERTGKGRILQKRWREMGR
jgi:hypothetical protein